MDSGGYHRDPASLSLAPLCEEMLHVRGVSIRSLRCQCSESGLKVVAETSIFETSSPREEPGPRTHIRITLTLKYVEYKREARWDAPENTNVRFSITRFLHVPPSPGRDGEDLEKARTICDVCNSPGRCAIKERRSKDDSDAERTLMITDTIRLPERKVAEAEFLLPSSMESGWGGIVLRPFLRVLRLAVEIPMRFSSAEPGNFATRLWLSVDLSGALPNAAWLS